MYVKEEGDGMLLEFICSNHKSIKDEVVFSMIAGSDNSLEEYLKEYNNIKVLSSAVIYGANGSGKSNFLDALLSMRNIVVNSINHQPGQLVRQVPHKLSDKETESVYKIQFIKNNIRYAYGFSLKKNLVETEYLYFFPNGKQTKIFERNKLTVVPGNKYKKSFELSITNILKENRLLLSSAANYSNVKEVLEAFLFFSNDLVFFNPQTNNWLEYSLKMMQEDVKIKQTFIDILQSLGTEIKDVSIKIKDVKFSEISNDIQMPDILKQMLKDTPTNLIDTKVVYNHFEVDLMSEESSGIKRLFEMICPIIDIIQNGKILVCDELETSVHESVIHQIIQMFQNNHNDCFSQLIFSTHDTSILDKDLFRRDQIWFTQMDDKRSTDLYSLAEIRNVRKTEDFEKGYISGKYGAIPMLNKSIFDIFKNDLDKMKVTS